MAVTILNQKESRLEMASLNPKKTGLPVSVWSEHQGIKRNTSHSGTARVKIFLPDDRGVSATIEAQPQILAQSKNMTSGEMKDIKKGIEYVGRNHDVFLKHYMDTDFSFDDDDLKDELRNRGEYK